MKAHRGREGAEVVVHRGLPMSSPIQCILELAAHLELVDLVVLGDSLVHAGAVSPEVLVTAAERWTGPGARKVRRAARLVRRGVESPMETRLRLLIVLAGLPEPAVAHEILADDGRVVARLDLSWPAWKVAVEYEGRHHAASVDQWGRDIARREDLDIRRWRLVIVKADGIYADPARTLNRIMAAIEDQGVIGIRVKDAGWRRHFPGHRASA